MNVSDPKIQAQLTMILKFVNSMPIEGRDAKLRLAKKILDEQYTTNPDEAYDEDKKVEEQKIPETRVKIVIEDVPNDFEEKEEEPENTAELASEDVSDESKEKEAEPETPCNSGCEGVCEGGLEILKLKRVSSVI